jgi:uncharacterized ferritin-like protein (DUF455 family)/nitrite reductase/ring-hydroxylating ferredoxin subunit
MIKVGKTSDFLGKRALVKLRNSGINQKRDGQINSSYARDSSNSVVPRQSTVVKVVVFEHDSNFYALDATCPHSGGPLFQGYIVDIEDSSQCELVCPWHHHRFNSCTGANHEHPQFNTTAYSIVIENDFVCLLLDNTEFQVENIDFIDVVTENLDKTSSATVPNKNQQDYSLVDWAVLILNTSDPTEKVRLTMMVHDKWFANEINQVGIDANVPNIPPREALKFVESRKTVKIGKGNSIHSRIRLLHALANVEQWAIDLAWDIIARFSSTQFESSNGIVLLVEQRDFYNDFVRIAAEEAKHYQFLIDRMEQLGGYYGQHPVHAGLWQSATATSDLLENRLAIVHMVHEARGLDVNPTTIKKFQLANDFETVQKLEIIHRDEIGHVAVAQKWFKFICDLDNRNRYKVFHGIVKKLFHGPLKPPFNDQDRQLAGLDEQYYRPLVNLEYD